MADKRIIIELVSASRAMLDAKGWHKIDGTCSICQRFSLAVELAEETLVNGEIYKVCKNCGKYGEGKFCMYCGTCFVK